MTGYYIDSNGWRGTVPDFDWPRYHEIKTEQQQRTERFNERQRQREAKHRREQVNKQGASK